MLKFSPTDELQKELSDYLSENLLGVIRFLNDSQKMTEMKIKKSN